MPQVDIGNTVTLTWAGSDNVDYAIAYGDQTATRVTGHSWTSPPLYTTTAFEGPADLRWWQVELGGDAAKWVKHVRVDQITGIRFVRAPYPFRPHFRGQEVLWEGFLGPGEDTFLHCYVGDLYDGRRMRLEKLAAWQALRER